MELTQLQAIGDEELHDFLNNAPKYFREGERIKKFQLKNGDYIHCVLWNYHFYITGTDIVKILVWRFQNSGKQLGNMKKFEEGIFSDLRNLKPGIDASLEGPRSEFLEFLYKNGCIRTQKKQKVFYWYSVPHDALFCDAMERDMRRDSSIYNYSGYNPERRPSYEIPKFNNIPKPPAQVYNNMFEQPRKQERAIETRNDLFNIKNTLFADIKPITNTLNSKDVLFDTPFPGNQLNTTQEHQFNKIFNMSSDSRMPHLEDYEDESRMNLIKSKIGSDLKKKFDDFDLDQLGFLKDRCQEHLGFGTGNCEKKRLSENSSIEDSNIGAPSKVRFLGMNNDQ